MLPLSGPGPAGRLRAYLPGDLDDLALAFTDPQIALWNPGWDSREEQLAFMQRRNDWSEGGHTSWAIADADDRLTGSVSLFKFELDQGEGEIGYWVAPWARGQGYAVRAVLTAARFCFEVVGLHRVILYHALENQQSCAVATRAGFQLEGRLRQSYRYPDGLYHDEHLHGLLRDDLTP